MTHFVAMAMFYLKAARRWPTMMKMWKKLDLSMDMNYGYPNSLDTEFTVIIAATLFHSLCSIKEAFLFIIVCLQLTLFIFMGLLAFSTEEDTRVSSNKTPLARRTVTTLHCTH